jgi:hypothetical protein
MKGELLKYLEIINDFANHKLPVEEFEKKYLKMVKDEWSVFSPQISEIIYTLFSDVDSYCGDPNIADYNFNDVLFGDIDENELRNRATKALKRLEDILW